MDKFKADPSSQSCRASETPDPEFALHHPKLPIAEAFGSLETKPDTRPGSLSLGLPGLVLHVRAQAIPGPSEFRVQERSAWASLRHLGANRSH